MGLPIAADLMRRAGGNLTVETIYGEYAEFVINLPLDDAPSSATQSESALT